MLNSVRVVLSLILLSGLLSEQLAAQDSNLATQVQEILKSRCAGCHAKGDYRLAAGSPAINAGSSPGGLTAVDIQGLSRPTFGAFEIGAFEYSGKSGSVRILDWAEMAAPPEIDR